MNIAVVGTGYVGLVSGACFASLGNRVICVDIDAKKIAALKKGHMPIYEPGLAELVRESVKRKTILFTTDLKSAVRKSEIIFIAVGTPSKADGDADLSYVENVAKTVAKEITGYKLIVEKSTVPVQTGERVRETIRQFARKGASFDVASNPEFLREGSAVRDFMNPDRVILGAESERAKKILIDLYKPLKCPVLVTDLKSAEIIKHASNSFLAMKISFINAISRVCDAAKADVELVAIGMGLDARIGKNFLSPGIGFGGSCFPKDLSAFIRISEKLGYDFELLRAVERVNAEQKRYFVKKIEEAVWNLNKKTVAVLGLAFKPNTDDMRHAPSLDVVAALQAQGAKVHVFDPHAMPKAKAFFKNVTFCADAYSACKDADCAVIVTEWNEFKEIDLKRLKKIMAQPVVVDGRNIYDPKKMAALGFRYFSIGRP